MALPLGITMLAAVQNEAEHVAGECVWYVEEERQAIFELKLLIGWLPHPKYFQLVI